MPERTVESWLAVELAVWFPEVRLWAPTQNSVGNWDLSASGCGKLLIFECKGCRPLKQGHSVAIDMLQLERYMLGGEFATVREHVFYVLPAPPWPGPIPAPGTPIALESAIPGHADARLASPDGGCWNWFHVIPATTLWEQLAASNARNRSVNTRRLPGPSAYSWPHHLGMLIGTTRLADFLEGVAKCYFVPLSNATPSESSSGEIDGEWHRPPERGDPPPDEASIPPGARVVAREEPPLRDARGVDAEAGDAESTPTPLAAFVPLAALAI
jgi:hypothetical protein